MLVVHLDPVLLDVGPGYSLVGKVRVVRIEFFEGTRLEQDVGRILALADPSSE